MTTQIRIFAGPTLFGTGLAELQDPTIEWLPPVKRGDIDKLLESKAAPGTLAIVDGTFHSYPSVSHPEIRHALEAGWVIYGLASMGAIRACEMAHLGMTPFGRVAQHYLDDPDFNDDEVTLVHGVEAPYVPLSEPLIHMRQFLTHMRAQGVMSEAQEMAILERLQPRWYAERTLPELRKALDAVFDKVPTECLAGLKDFKPYRVKQADLVEFIRVRPWQSSAAA